MYFFCDAEKDVTKRLLNHLLGRFGMNIVKPITELVNVSRLSLIQSTRKVVGEPKKITGDAFWITYYPEVDQEICELHNRDYFKVSNLQTSRLKSVVTWKSDKDGIFIHKNKCLMIINIFEFFLLFFIWSER